MKPCYLLIIINKCTVTELIATSGVIYLSDQVELVPEWQCRDEWCWQLLPVNPLGQLHLYKLASESSQAPPF